MNRYKRRMASILLLATGIFFHTTAWSQHTFQIRNGSFLYDGKPMEIRSGEIHFSRIPSACWRQRLKMLKSMGMNAVATYVFWNYQETAPGVWNFRTGNHNIANFIKMAGEEGLLVILRPGPYACAEWEFGGFPWWLQLNKALKLRTDNPAYLDSCKIYIDMLARQVRGLQITHGGPIILVQVENEFGSYAAQRPDIPSRDDNAYLLAIRQDLADAGFDVPFFTADGSGLFKMGTVAGVLPGANGEDNIEKLVKRVNQYHGGQGPYFVPEFYPGWLDHWQEPFRKVATSEVVKQLGAYLRARVSFNLYMADGGTNFGFWSGANYTRSHPIQPDLTSYDYDAPISEAGWITPKYLAIRKEISLFVHHPLPAVPPRDPVISIPPVRLKKAVDLFEIAAGMKPVLQDTPLSFEALGQGYGYVLYRKDFTDSCKGILSVSGLRDYATVYINRRQVAILSRPDSLFSCRVDIPAGGTLELLVENMGRINYGAEISHNLKGIISPVTIGGKEITGSWAMYGFPFTGPPDLSSFRDRNQPCHPEIYSGTFILHRTGDTFLDMTRWGKGIVFVNGHNLGRYWNAGPQQTLYLPGSWLNRGKNRIMIFDQLNRKKHTRIRTRDTPVLDQLGP